MSKARDQEPGGKQLSTQIVGRGWQYVEGSQVPTTKISASKTVKPDGDKALRLQGVWKRLVSQRFDV